MIIRNLIWTVRRNAYQNPPWPERVDAILFVCLGNICRSPFAALLTARRLADAGVTDIRCASAGTLADQSQRSPSDAQRAAAPYGVQLAAHRPQLLNEKLLTTHDIVFVMEPGQMARLRRRFPAEAHRVFLMPLFDTPPPSMGAYERLHFIDPVNRGPQAFADCYTRIDRAVTGIVAQVGQRFRR